MIYLQRRTCVFATVCLYLPAQPRDRIETGMSRRINTRTGRRSLEHRKAPHWHVIEKGLAVGYYRPKAGAGTWWARALLGGAYRVSALGSADDHAEADGTTVLNWSQAQANARAWAKGAGGEALTVATAVYIDDLRARKGGRAAGEVRGRLGKHLLPVLGTRQLAKLTTRDLRQWRNGLVRTDSDAEAVRRSRDTANRVLTMAKAAFNLAFKGGRVADDLAWRRVEPFEAVSQPRKVVLGEAELQRLADACGPGLRELVLVGALTGARLGELTSAAVRDFDTAAAVLVVRGKTGERPIHLPPAAVAVLRRLASGKRPDGYLLTTAAGEPWTKSLHKRPFAAAVARTGLDPATVFYSLRHSWITRALGAGVPVKSVADHCGTSMAMLQRYYAKAIKSDLERYATKAAPALDVTGEAVAKVVPLTGGRR
jgi:integrase